jgi:hypothetical protein
VAAVTVLRFAACAATRISSVQGSISMGEKAFEDSWEQLPGPNLLELRSRWAATWP